MRREREINKFAIISIVVSAIIIIITLGIIIVNSSNKHDEEEFARELSSYSKREETESASSKLGKNIEESRDTEAESNEEEVEIAKFSDNITEEKLNKQEEKTKTTPSTTNKKEEKKQNIEQVKKDSEKKDESKQEEIKFEAPIKGTVIREFAKDTLVFSNTLQEWTTHTAVDIKADKTSVVKSAADGTVYAIKNDPRYGLTVIINHDNGYQTIYSNLLTSEFVVKGEKVKKGQSIGTVGNTASFEIADESHLHFELLKNNEYLDPVIYINFE